MLLRKPKNWMNKALHKVFATLVFLFLLLPASWSQTRSYSLVYSDNIKGESTVFGNGLLHIITNKKVDITKMNSNHLDGNSFDGNDEQDMEYIDIDGSSGEGKATWNSSSSDLVLPGGSNTIRLARLYWGGRIKDADVDLSAKESRTVKIRKGTSGNYADVTATGLDKTLIISGYTEYQAYADITALVKSGGAGTYEVGNVPLATGSISNGGNNGGWSIVVVYENSSMPYNSIRIYDGFQQVYNGGNTTTSTVTLTGLDVPSGTLEAAEAKMGVVAWEGDANLSGDFLKINGVTFSNTINPSDNPWNGTISDNGQHVTTKNPNYTNQMGIDIDLFNVGKGYGILPNANSVTLQFGTEQDQYYPGVFTFTIKMKDPTITLDKMVADANHNHLGEVGEILTYTLKGGNKGPGNANDIILSDTLPGSVTYLRGTMKVISSPGIIPGVLTDQAGDDIAEYRENGAVKSVVFRIGTGASGSSGGTLAANETYEVQFQVVVNDPGKGLPPPSIMNIARITSRSDAMINFVDDGTAIINPEAGPMPVTLEKFTAALTGENTARIDWSTSMEINCDRFIIQKSYDGTIFYDGQSVLGNGTTNLFHTYWAADTLSGFAGKSVFYRLKQIDLDGKENLSKVVALPISTSFRQIKASPIPFDSYLSLQVDWRSAQQITLRLLNVQGKEVFNRMVAVHKGINFIRLDDLSPLPKGIYLVQLLSSSETITKKVIK